MHIEQSSEIPHTLSEIPVLHAKLLSHFRDVFVSSSIGLRKPNADAYEHVIKKLGI